MSNCYSKEITILYTGETHAMLYPCHCPKEPDGGIARRVTLVKELRKKYPHLLLLDSGAFFAGGLMDEYTQNTELDKARTQVSLKAMALMQYDAANIGDDEFNFGRDFLEENTVNSKVAFLSLNVKSEKFLPYIIKEIDGIKIAIMGVAPLSAIPKAGGLKFIEPKIAVKNTVAELKKKSVNLIVLLSRLGESDDLALIEEVKGIDILISGHSRNKEDISSKVGSTLILKASWQGRRLGKLSLTLGENNKIINYKAEELRLSNKISDAPEMLSILPACFSDAQCQKKGAVGTCLEPGSKDSHCQFSIPNKITLSIITPKICRACETKAMATYLERQFPGLVISYLYYPGLKADKLIKDFGINALPAYILGKEIEKESNFSNLSKNLEKLGEIYLAKKEFAGFSYFLNRKRIEGKLDLFISLFNKDTPSILEAIKSFHVEKYYPRAFWDYISCRAKNINSSWWEDCLGDLNSEKIRACARTNEAEALLKENIALNKELQVMFGPVYLLDNQEIFSTEGVPTENDLKKIFKR
ncbi:MAG: metallophosphatase [Candidatus Omnitrophica bacterium]|nr:metallophosphatase [Candidatus Omnitrophota bacterium]